MSEEIIKIMAACLIGAGVFIYTGIKSFKIKRLIENIPTSKIRIIATGQP